MPVPLLDLKAQHATIRDEMVKAVIDVVDSQLFILGDRVKDVLGQLVERSGNIVTK